MMVNSKTIKIFPLLAAASVALLFYISVHRPYLFGESNLLALLALVAAGFIASQFETHFWTLMIVVFFWAGSAFPLAGAMNLFRWVVLTVGAFLSLGYYARSANRISFNHQHLLGLFAVVAAFASAMVSVNPLMTILKALSLAALFIYASIGARILWARNPEPFVRRLVLLSEGLVYFTAICYSARFEVWGNPGINHGVYLLAGVAVALDTSRAPPRIYPPCHFPVDLWRATRGKSFASIDNRCRRDFGVLVARHQAVSNPAVGHEPVCGPLSRHTPPAARAFSKRLRNFYIQEG
jgi:hypothetical protein